MDGRPTLFVKHLLCGFGFHIDLHKMVAEDNPNCFHTHPAFAVRLILRGGYVEELESGTLRTWRPGMAGVVEPSCSHRIARLLNGRSSFSLWLRLRKTAKVSLRGSGWAEMDQAFRAANTVLETKTRTALAGKAGET